jgi:hypothetical protein
MNTMVIGHFAIGLALKRVNTTLSLGLLFVVVQLSDLPTELDAHHQTETDTTSSLLF